MKKYRYEYPSRQSHYVEAPTPKAVVEYIQRTYPHNSGEVLPTVAEIPRWPEFWKTLDEHGRVLPRPKLG